MDLSQLVNCKEVICFRLISWDGKEQLRVGSDWYIKIEIIKHLIFGCERNYLNIESEEDNLP